MFKVLNIYYHCAITAAQKRVMFYIGYDKYTGLIRDLKKCRNFTFSHFAENHIENVKYVLCLGALNRDRMTEICDITFLNLNNLAS